MDRIPLTKKRTPPRINAVAYDFNSCIKYPTRGNPKATVIPDENITIPYASVIDSSPNSSKSVNGIMTYVNPCNIPLTKLKHANMT